MDKVLKVKKSFLGTDVNDIFEYDKENNTYELNKNHTYSQVEDGNPYTVKSSYEVSLSADNINDLINKGYLVPVKDDNKKVLPAKDFCNYVVNNEGEFSNTINRILDILED